MVKKQSCQFDQGDIIFMNFSPQSGHEQMGRRPALVVSNNLFNRVSNMTMVCPITNTDRSSPFHVRLDNRTSTTGVVMCDQVKMLDINNRNGSFVETAPSDIIAEVVDIIISIIEF